MNKKIMIGIISTAIVVILGACGNMKDTSTNNNKATFSSQTMSTSSLLNQDFKISLDDAIQLFSKELPDVAITSIEFDKSFGNYGYKIEGVDEIKEYEIFVDADTKEKSKQREERLDAEDANGVARKNNALLLDNIISPEKAMKIAFSEIKKKGDIIDWKLSQEMQKTYYEVTVKNRLSKTEVKIDSVSGAVLKIEQDD